MEARPVYRHVVVQRKALVEHVDPEKLRRLRQQMMEGLEIDEDLRHLVVKDTLKKSVRKAMGWAGHGDVDVQGSDDGMDAGQVFAEADARQKRGDGGDDEAIRYRRQEGVIVSSLVKDQVPGDLPGQAMPRNPSYLFHSGFDAAENRQAEFMRCAQELHAKFQAFSDRKFMLLDPELRSGVTLVTVVLTPIIGVPRTDNGVELLCEFHQKTQFGHIATDGFDVFSEIGEYPVQVPSDGDMAMMFTTFDEFKAMEAGRGS